MNKPGLSAGSTKQLNILVLGRGKTGALVAEIAAERGHRVETCDLPENLDGKALTPEFLERFDVAIDFTTPDAVHANIAACLRAKKSMVVGTTGWYGSLPEIPKQVEAAGTGFVYGSNFSIGMNIFFAVTRAAAVAARHGYSINVSETHHIHKKDAPSGTAISLREIVESVSGKKPEIQSVREGEVVGNHTVVMDSVNDTLTLVHHAKSRRGFAEGAVLAAEWVCAVKGFYDFREIFDKL